MHLNSRSFAPMLGAVMLVLAGCQTAPKAADAPVAPPAQAAQAAPPAAPDVQAPAPAASHVAFFIGQSHSEPSLTALKMADGATLYVQRVPILTREDISQAHDLVDKQGRHFVGLRFTEAGTRKLAEVSSESVGKRLVLILDGKVAAAPIIHQPLNRGVLAFSVPTAQGAANLAARIRGEQPAPVKPGPRR